jgi:hypothetical protein
VTGKSQRKLVTGNPASVVSDLDEAAPSLPDLDPYLRRSCVYAVLYEFLDYGSGSLYDLSGCDLARYLGGQYSNRHGSSRDVQAICGAG